MEDILVFTSVKKIRDKKLTMHFNKLKKCVEIAYEGGFIELRADEISDLVFHLRSFEQKIDKL